MICDDLRLYLGIVWKELTRKPHPNPKPFEKLRVVNSGPFFPHDLSLERQTTRFRQPKSVEARLGVTVWRLATNVE